MPWGALTSLIKFWDGWGGIAAQGKAPSPRRDAQPGNICTVAQGHLWRASAADEGGRKQQLGLVSKHLWRLRVKTGRGMNSLPLRRFSPFLPVLGYLELDFCGRNQVFIHTHQIRRTVSDFLPWKETSALSIHAELARFPYQLGKLPYPDKVSPLTELQSSGLGYSPHP